MSDELQKIGFGATRAIITTAVCPEREPVLNQGATGKEVVVTLDSVEYHIPTEERLSTGDATPTASETITSGTDIIGVLGTGFSTLPTTTDLTAVLLAIDSTLVGIDTTGFVTLATDQNITGIKTFDNEVILTSIENVTATDLDINLNKGNANVVINIGNTDTTDTSIVNGMEIHYKLSDDDAVGGALFDAFTTLIEKSTAWSAGGNEGAITTLKNETGELHLGNNGDVGLYVKDTLAGQNINVDVLLKGSYVDIGYEYSYGGLRIGSIDPITLIISAIVLETDPVDNLYVGLQSDIHMFVSSASSELFFVNQALFNMITLTEELIQFDKPLTANEPIQVATGTINNAPINFPVGTLTTSTDVDGGDLEYDGDVFYGTTTDSKRGVVAVSHFRALTSNVAFTNNTSVQQCFSTLGKIALVASTTYDFEMELYIESGGTAHNIAIQFDSGTATFTSMAYSSTGFTVSSIGSFSNTTRFTLGIDETLLQVTDSSTDFGSIIKLKGIVRVNAGGTFIPEFFWSAAPGAGNILKNSFIKLTPIGSNIVSEVGDWS